MEDQEHEQWVRKDDGTRNRNTASPADRQNWHPTSVRTKLMYSWGLDWCPQHGWSQHVVKLVSPGIAEDARGEKLQ